MRTERPLIPLRVLWGALLALSFFALPSLWTLCIAVAGLFLFPWYWEFLFMIILNELYYGSVVMIENTPYAFLPLYGVAVFVLIEVGRSFLRQGAFRG